MLFPRVSLLLTIRRICAYRGTDATPPRSRRSMLASNSWAFVLRMQITVNLSPDDRRSGRATADGAAFSRVDTSGLEGSRQRPL